MRRGPFIFIALLAALLFGGAPGAKAFAKTRVGDIYEAKGGKVLFHIYAGSEQICTFETNSPLMGGSDSTKVGDYYHQDQLTSSSVLSSSSGGQTEVNVWYPFGSIQTASPQASFQVSRRFTGQVYDNESGLYYYNARYYAPELGRFIQADTVISDFSNPQSYNRYSYCVNDPLRYNDPSGHELVMNAGLVVGPYPYMVAKTPIGQIGAGIYNTLPLTANTFHIFASPFAWANDRAGDVLQAGTQLVTRDAQLAQNSRNLTMVVGLGELGKMAKVEQVVTTTAKAEDTVSLEQRANELHSLLHPQAQRMRTTAVTATQEGITVVSSSENALTKVQKAALKPGEMAAEGLGHAEITGVNAATQAGLTPTATAASRPICPTSAQTLKEQGVTPASSLKVP